MKKEEDNRSVMLLMVSFKSKNYGILSLRRMILNQLLRIISLVAFVSLGFDIIYFNCDCPTIVIFEYTLLTALPAVTSLFVSF